MTPRRKQRLAVAVVIVLALGGATALFLTAFSENLMFFFSPSEVHAGAAPSDHDFRVGGVVVPDSVERQEDGLTVRFKVTDGTHGVPVRYKGILPDLFREGQTVIARGSLNDEQVFVAREVLAKHDENYMPPEVADALKKGGYDKMPDDHPGR